MPYKNVFIQNDSRIGIKYGQLNIINDRDNLIPLEDIASILIESTRSIITTYALGKLSDSGIVTIICDEKKLPCGVLTPLFSHSRQQKMLYLQFGISKPFKKRMWQKIVKSKIHNQAKCLEINKKPGCNLLYNLVSKVDSGDNKNIEATAATKYFKYLYGDSFSRGDNGIYNAAMNYGYAIIRSLIARHICICGFVPCMGIHHHSELNNFNLADDLIEPFRALVDAFVYQNFSPEEAELTTQGKIALYNLVNYQVVIGQKVYSVHTAITHYVKTFVSACKKSDVNILEIPVLNKVKVSMDE